MSKLLLYLLSFPAVAETLTGGLGFGPGWPYLAGKLETQPSKVFWVPSLSFEFPPRWPCGSFAGSCKTSGGTFTDTNAEGVLPLFALRQITFTFKFLPSVVTLSGDNLTGSIRITATGHITNRTFDPVTHRLTATVESDFVDEPGEFVYELTKADVTAKAGVPVPPAFFTLTAASFYFPPR